MIVIKTVGVNFKSIKWRRNLHLTITELPDIRYPWSVFATRLGSGGRKRPEAGRFRKFVEFEQSKGIGRRVWLRRSRFGYWFGRPRRRGGEIDDFGV